MRFKPGLELVTLCALLILGGCRPAYDWHWERAEAGLPRQTVVLALASDPTNPNRLWAGYYAPGGLATSHDGGKTWTSNAQGLGDNPVFDLLPLPDAPLWAATRDGLMESNDGGASWRPVIGGLPPTGAFALAADASGNIYVGLDDAGLYTTEPGTGKWTPLACDEPLATAAVLSLAVSPDGTQLYAGTAGQGLFASQDAGHSWMAAFPYDYVPNLALNPSRPRTAVVSLRDRLVRTRDGGEVWEMLPIPWARSEVVSLLWLGDPLAQSGPLTETGPLAGTAGTLWAGTGQGQIYYSSDEGDSWVELKNHPPTQGGVLALATAGDRLESGPHRLLAGTWTGIYAITIPQAGANHVGWGDDGTQSWTYLSPSLGIPYANALSATNAGLLIGTRAGLFRWQPSLRHWTQVPLEYSQGSESPPEVITALAVAPSDELVVYAGTTASGLYRSDDGGASWARVPSDPELGIRALAIAPEDADHVYALAAWERMYESSDGGRSWQSRWTGLGVTTEAISLALDPLDFSTVYLGADTGLYRSLYEGENWRPVGHPLDEQTVLTLVARPVPGTERGSSVLYIGATRGAYRSYDAGDAVEPWGHGLEEVSVTALMFDPNNSQTVYAGTAYAGLYRSADGGETWRQLIGPPELADEVVEAMAWGSAGELFVASAGGVWVGRTKHIAQ